MCLISSIRLQNPWDRSISGSSCILQKKKKWAQFSLLSDNECAGETIKWIIFVMLLYNIWETEGKGVTSGSSQVQPRSQNRCTVFMWLNESLAEPGLKTTGNQEALAWIRAFLNVGLMSLLGLTPDNFFWDKRIFPDLQMNLGGAISSESQTSWYCLVLPTLTSGTFAWSF